QGFCDQSRAVGGKAQHTGALMVRVFQLGEFPTRLWIKQTDRAQAHLHGHDFAIVRKSRIATIDWRTRLPGTDLPKFATRCAGREPFAVGAKANWADMAGGKFLDQSPASAIPDFRPRAMVTATGNKLPVGAHRSISAILNGTEFSRF